MTLPFYRSHTCGALRPQHVGQTVRLSGWVQRKRDHGQLLFIDLRDHYGLTQLVCQSDSAVFALLEKISHESVICVTGEVVARSPDTVNDKLPTGGIEVRVTAAQVLSAAAPLPLQVNSDEDGPEDTRLKYRFLDLRRDRMHRNIILRSQIINSLRRRMQAANFNEFQTPILTASSPEGARDFLVPSRHYAGKFYALPQAPQMFKQLLMVAGFDRYFQIAPCFRDEDLRADRTLEFYQLDFEMSFVTQDDVFATIEPVIHGVFSEFASTSAITPLPWPAITYADALLQFGSDKPDLRNPLRISDVSTVFADSDFSVFAKAVAKGAKVRAIPAPQTADKPRSFFDKLNDWAKAQGAPGLGYITFVGSEAKGPIAKFLTPERLTQLRTLAGLQAGDSVFFVCDIAPEKLAGLARTEIAQQLGLIEQNALRFCRIVDFPFYEKNPDTGAIEFVHNPFSSPQGGLDALNTKPPLEILAQQYDFVCNGYELASGGIRNYDLECMYRACEIAGLSRDYVAQAFAGLVNAFQYGTPPHGGAAFGIDRVVMLIAGEPNLREINAFPPNQKGVDEMMGAPAIVAPERLRELHLRLAEPPVKKVS